MLTPIATQSVLEIDDIKEDKLSEFVGLLKEKIGYTNFNVISGFDENENLINFQLIVSVEGNYKTYEAPINSPEGQLVIPEEGGHCEDVAILLYYEPDKVFNLTEYVEQTSYEIFEKELEENGEL